jgi:hypothetical protein
MIAGVMGNIPFETTNFFRYAGTLLFCFGTTPVIFANIKAGFS